MLPSWLLTSWLTSRFIRCFPTIQQTFCAVLSLSDIPIALVTCVHLYES